MMFHARALLAAISLTVSPALAVTVPTCEQVREHAKNLTRKQIHGMAKRARLTEAQWAQVKSCLPKDKR